MLPFPPAPRPRAAYEPHHHRFIVTGKRNYTIQYSHIYVNRLRLLGPLAKQALAMSADGRSHEYVEKVIDLGAKDPGTRIGVIGTLYKEQKLKPCVLDEFASENDEAARARGAFSKSSGSTGASSSFPKGGTYSSDDDVLRLEDESGRVTLAGLTPEIISRLVTGIVCGVSGVLTDSGELECTPSSFHFPSASQISAACTKRMREPSKSSGNGTGRLLVLVSDLSYPSNDPRRDEAALRLSLLADWLGGHFARDGGDPALRAVRVVVAGGGVAASSTRIGDTISLDAKATTKLQESLVEPFSSADRVFAEMAASVPLDLMPGIGDANVSVPQQPLNLALFPISSRLVSNFKRVTNPYEFSLCTDEPNPVRILGHSGQPVKDALTSTNANLTELDLMELSLLRWRHLAPTAPDTLPCFPIRDHDPFAVELAPDVFFAGSSDAFDTSLVDGTRLICVPRFRESGAVVLVDLDSPGLDTTTFTFDVSALTSKIPVEQ